MTGKYKVCQPANQVRSQTRATGANQGHLGQISALKSPKHEELEPDKTLGAYACLRLCSLELLQTPPELLQTPLEVFQGPLEQLWAQLELSPAPLELFKAPLELLMAALHNALFVQYLLLATEQVGSYFKSCVLLYHLTYIYPSLFGCEQNTFVNIFVRFKL